MCVVSGREAHRNVLTWKATWRRPRSAGAVLRFVTTGGIEPRLGSDSLSRGSISSINAVYEQCKGELLNKIQCIRARISGDLYNTQWTVLTL